MGFINKDAVVAGLSGTGAVLYPFQAVPHIMHEFERGVSYGVMDTVVGGLLETLLLIFLYGAIQNLRGK